VLSQGNRRGIRQFQSGKLAFNVRIADHSGVDAIFVNTSAFVGINPTDDE
jgi:hypothetical protein